MLIGTVTIKVLEKVYEVALSDGHPGQMAAMKLVLDRIVPASAFDTTKSAGSTPQISINITGLNSPSVNTEQVYDVSYVEFTERDVDE